MSDIVFGTDGSETPEPQRPASAQPPQPAPARPVSARPVAGKAAARPVPGEPATDKLAAKPVSATEGPRDDMTRLLGQIVTLLGQSPAHRHVFIADLEWLVLPALMARQARIWRRQTENGALPVIYVSWALVDEAVETRLRQGQMRLKPNEWRCGDRAWLIDVVAPFGGADAALSELADQHFPGRVLHTLAPSSTGGFSVREIRGKAAG